MLMIRLQRVGRKNYAEFRIVVTEKTRPAKSSNYVEVVGNYNPHTNTTVVKADRITYWIEKGAQVSGTVHNILVSQNIIKGKKVNVLPKKTPIIKEKEAQPEETSAPVEEKQTEAPAEETPVTA